MSAHKKRCPRPDEVPPTKAHHVTDPFDTDHCPRALDYYDARDGWLTRGKTLQTRRQEALAAGFNTTAANGTDRYHRGDGLMSGAQVMLDWLAR